MPAMLETLIPVAVFVVGLFTGAWLVHRARNGESPLPQVWPERKPEPEKKTKLPEVKP